MVIPAFNEAATIGSVIASVHNHNFDVVVVDDGSTDETAVIARAAGAVVVSHGQNLGYDAALATGLIFAAKLSAIVVTIDADAQHNAACVARLTAPLTNRTADVAVGCRATWPRMSERLFAKHGSRRHGIPDLLCGMKAIRSELVVVHEISMKKRSEGSALAVACQRSGARVTSVPIEIRSRSDESRLGSGLRAELRIGMALLRCMVLDAVAWVRRWGRLSKVAMSEVAPSLALQVIEP